MNLGQLSLVFVQDLVQLFKAHSKASRLLKMCKNTAGIEGAKWGKLTKGMPPHQGLNPSTQRQKICDVEAAKKKHLSATKSFQQKEG